MTMTANTGAARRKSRARWLTPALLPALLLAPLSALAAEPITDCAAVGGLVPYCGLPHPEDLEPLPGGKGLLVSEMNISRGPKGVFGEPGSLKWLDPKTRTVTVLYPAASAPPGRAIWGDPSCTTEIGTDLMAHGFHLSRRNDGAWQLLAVNHSDRESVEFFELIDNNGQWALSWRGCAIPPPPNRLNDVVGLADGSLLVTTMHRLGNVDASQAKQLAKQGENTGLLWRWHPKDGFSEQPGSAAPRPNGVQVDADGRYAYLNCAANGGEVRKIDLQAGKVVGTVALPHPDNSSWAADGRLLVAGADAKADSAVCFANPDVPCFIGFQVYAIDPATMTMETLFAHAGPPGGAATVAVQVDNDLFVGSFAGDRVLSVPGLFKPAAKK